MLRTSIIEEITEIVGIPPSLKKRLKRECNLMNNKFDEIIVDFSDQKNIYVSLVRKNNLYTFTIPFNYPFIQPTLTINGFSQYHFFNLKSPRFSQILKYVSGLNCFCCQSYLCRNNWSPGLTLDKLVEQFESFKTFKYYIFIKLLIDKIKEKYLNRDIDIDSWLFKIHHIIY